MEAHDMYMDTQGQQHVNITARPRLHEFKSIGQFGVALERWAHEENVAKRRIDTAHDAMPSDGHITYETLMKRLQGED